MTAQQVTEYCLSKPGAVQDYPFGSEPVVYKVGGKVFATIYAKDGTTRFGMKCDPMLADLLRGQYSSVTLMYIVKPLKNCYSIIAQYAFFLKKASLCFVGFFKWFDYKSPNWIYIHENGDTPDSVVYNQIDHSYDLIVQSLPKKTRERIRAEAAQKPEMTAKDAVEIVKLLEQHGVEVYVDGGWGVDALLGEQTRAHEDLDITLPHRFVPKLRELLETRGYKDVPRDDTRDCNFVLGDDKGHLVDVHSYTFDENGRNIFGVAYEKHHLIGSGIIDGYYVKCPPPDVMAGFHTGYDVDENDYRDVKALCERFGIPLPKEYERFEAE